MRWWLACLALSAIATGCDPLTPPPSYPPSRISRQPAFGGAGVDDAPPQAPVQATVDPGRVVQTSSDFAFNGGRIDFEMRQAGARVTQLARNRYMVPLVVEWEVFDLRNLSPTSAQRGVAILPPAKAPNGDGPAVELASMQVIDASVKWARNLTFHARFGDPNARPSEYAYALPYNNYLSFSVLQGFHGAFSHRGSNEFAVDFDCPVATTVRATRPGIVVVTHDAAQGSGTTPEFLDYSRVNFVLVLHDDGTLGEYMHLSPSGVEVAPGQHVDRGQALALSGNTGFSTTPHLHFQIMTAADDGIAARSFPFEFEVASNRVEEPVQGRSYQAWE